jgi:hypothetical protein
VFNEVCDESGDVTEETAANWIAKLPSIVDGYKAKETANGDKTGQFFHALPRKTLYLKGRKCSGGRFCKERSSLPLWLYDWR